MSQTGTGQSKTSIKKSKNKYLSVRKQSFWHMSLHIPLVKQSNQKLLHNKSDNNINIGIYM
jgi:hypothetical protein